MGLALDSTYAYLMGLLPQTPWQRILTTLRTLGFALYDPRMEVEHGLLDGLEEFREHLGGRLTVMLLWDIGQGLEVHEIDPDLVRESLRLTGKRGRKLFRVCTRTGETPVPLIFPYRGMGGA